MLLSPGICAAAYHAVSSGNVVMAARKQLTESAGSTSDLTNSGFGGTPLAGWFVGNRATVDATDYPLYDAISFGATDGTNMHASHRHLSYNTPASGTIRNASVQSTTYASYSGHYDGSAFQETKAAAFNALISNGVRFDLTNNTYSYTENRHIGGLLFRGAGLSKAAGALSLPTTTGATVDAVPGWKPPVILFNTTFTASVGSSHTYLVLGVAVLDAGGATYTQYCFTRSTINDANYYYDRSGLYNNAVVVSAQNATNTNIDRTYAVTPLATGFRLTCTSVNPSLTPGTVGYLALDGISGKIIPFATPTTATTLSVTGVGATPIAVLQVASMCLAENTIYLGGSANDTECGISHVTVMDPTDQYVFSSYLDTVRGSTDKAGCRTDSGKAFALYNYATHTLTERLTATFTGMTSDGYGLSFSTADASARRCFALCLY